MSRKSARKKRFADNNPELVGKEKAREEESASAEDTPSEESLETSPESPMGEELEEMQKAVAAMSDEELGSWSSCMSRKITDHYGPQVKACTDGITHGNWEKILECIVNVLGITDPEVWIPEQLAYFTVWSAECIFGESSPSTPEDATEVTEPVESPVDNPADVDGDGDVDADDVAAVTEAAITEAAEGADEEE